MTPVSGLPEVCGVTVIQEVMDRVVFGISDSVLECTVELRVGVRRSVLVDGKGSGAFFIPPLIASRAWCVMRFKKEVGDSIDIE